MTKGIIIKDVKISWLGHDGFLFEFMGKKIFIDPFQLNESSVQSADIVLITHNHYDHCSIADLQKICNKQTIILCPIDCVSSLAGKVEGKPIVIEPGKKLKAENIIIEAVPAYNTNKRFHPKENHWVGYILDFNGVRIYHAGDTDKIEEMKNFRVNVALVPVSGTYVMTADEAAMAINEYIKPNLAIPMHFGSGVVGTIADAERFKSLCKCDCKILEK